MSIQSSSPIYLNSSSTSFNIVSPPPSSSSTSSSSSAVSSSSSISPLSTSPIKRSPSIHSVIPPLPPSSSAKFPLELTSKNQTCIVRLDLDKTYFSNGSNITGKVIVNLTERQCLKRIKIQISGYEKIFQEKENNTYQTLKFYSDEFNISPLNFIKDINDPIINYHPNHLQHPNHHNHHQYVHYQNNNNSNGNEQQQQQQDNQPMSLSFNSLGFVHEFEAGTYEYRFDVKLPSFIQPSLNYIGFLSIFYMTHCKVEYSKGKDWKENKILKSTEFMVSGINQQYQNYLKRFKTHFLPFKISEFLWRDKSKPFEMALCLAENNVYIGDNALLYIKIKNPLSVKFNSIKVDLFQQITFKKQQYPLLKLNRQHMAFFKHGNQFHPVNSNNSINNNNENCNGLNHHPGEKNHNCNPHKHKVSITQILSLTFDSSHLNNNNDNNNIHSTQIKVIIPKSFQDDQVYPSTRGHLSTIKHYFIVSIPSINNLKIKIPFTLWEKEKYLPLTNGNHFHSPNSIFPLQQYQQQQQSLSSLSSSPPIKQPSPLSSSPQNDYLNNNNNNNNDDNNDNNNNINIDNGDEFKPPENWKIYWLSQWKDETNESKCNLCDSSFSIIKRIHHCRNCGGVFCESCSSQKYSLFSYGIHKKVRICLMCVENIKEKQLNYFQLSQIQQDRSEPPILFSKKKQQKHPFLIDIVDYKHFH